MRILLELGSYDAAAKIAQEAMQVNRKNHPVFQAKARLADLACFTSATGETLIGELQALAVLFQQHNGGYEQWLTQLHLLRALIVHENEAQAQALAQSLRPIAQRFGKGLKALAGPDQEFIAVWELLGIEPERVSLQVAFLGKTRALSRGEALALGLAEAEILTLLALHPKGWTLEKLAWALYADRGQTRAVQQGLEQLRSMGLLAEGGKPPRVGFSRGFSGVSGLAPRR